jgi:hypothetical protein
VIDGKCREYCMGAEGIEERGKCYRRMSDRHKDARLFKNLGIMQ